jgi:hypothetical protein
VVNTKEGFGMRKALLALALVAAPISAWASGKLSYGSRAGMTVTVRSMVGLDTSNAIIKTEHTRDDAIGFCRDYSRENPVTERCIRGELATPMNDAIYANCSTGIFTDFFGNKYQFQGKNTHPSEGGPEYLLMNLQTQQIADGSSASGYDVNMDIFRALCPRTAPPPDAVTSPTDQSAKVNATSLEGCYQRVYDETHLRRHERQLVTRASLLVGPAPKGFESGSLRGTFKLWLRGTSKSFDSLGACRHQGKGLSCEGSISAAEAPTCRSKQDSVRNCRMTGSDDAGRFTIEPAENGVLVTIRERLELVTAPYDAGPFLYFSPGNVENHDFILYRQVAGACN